MKKKIMSIVSIGMISALVLTGCTAEDMATIEEMQSNVEIASENINSFVDQINEIDFDEINANIEAMQESVEMINEWTEANAATINEAAELAESINTINAGEFSEDEISDAVAELIKGTAIEQAHEFAGRGEEAFEEAEKTCQEGLNMMAEAQESLATVFNDSESVDKLVDGTFDNIDLWIDGSNTVVAGGLILIREVCTMGDEVIAVSDALGIETPEVEALRKSLEIAKSTEIFFVAPITKEYLQEARPIVKSAIEEGEASIVDSELAKELVSAIFESSKYIREGLERMDNNSANINRQINRAYKSIIKEAKANGIEELTVDDLDIDISDYENIEIGVTVYPENFDELVSLAEEAALSNLDLVSEVGSNEVYEVIKEYLNDDN